MSSSEDPQKPRRFGRRDRKERLDPVAPLFLPPENRKPEPDMPLPPPDFDQLKLPDVDQEALEALAQLTPDEVRTLNITPLGERFPELPDEQGPDPTLPMRASAAPASPRPAPQPSPARQRARRYNRISLLALLGSIAIGALYALIWADPFTPINPFPPEVVVVYVTATPQASLPAAAQNTASESAPAAADGSAFPFVASDVLYTPNANERGCEYASIAGSVTDLNGEALSAYRVRISGPDGLEETVFTGAARTFGPGSYELPLGNLPIAADYTVQLFSPATSSAPSGLPLSELISVPTRADCEGAVAIINFQQLREF